MDIIRVPRAALQAIALILLFIAGNLQASELIYLKSDNSDTMFFADLSGKVYASQKGKLLWYLSAQVTQIPVNKPSPSDKQDDRIENSTDEFDQELAIIKENFSDRYEIPPLANKRSWHKDYATMALDDQSLVVTFDNEIYLLDWDKEQVDVPKKVKSHKLESPIRGSYFYRGWVYLLTLDNKIYCLDRKDFSIKWMVQSPIDEVKDYDINDLIFINDTIFWPLASRIKVISAVSGQSLWRLDVPRPIEALEQFPSYKIYLAQVNGVSEFIISYANNIMGYDINGEQKWSHSGYNLLWRPVFKGKNMAFLTSNYKLVSLDKWEMSLSSGSKQWPIRWFGPYFLKEDFFIVNNYAEAVLINFNTGKVIRRQKLSAKLLAKPPLVEGGELAVVGKKKILSYEIRGKDGI